MNTLITSLARLLIFPGLLFAVPCRLVLPLGGAQGRGADAGPHRAALHAAVLRLHQAAGQDDARPQRHCRNADARMAADCGFLGCGRGGPVAGAARFGRLSGRLDSAAGAARTAFDVHHRGGLHLRVPSSARSARRARRSSASATTSSFCWPFFPSPPRSTPSAFRRWRCCRPRRCAGWALWRCWFACPPSCI